MASDGEFGGAAVFTGDKAALAFVVELCGVGEIFFRGATRRHPPLVTLYGYGVCTFRCRYYFPPSFLTTIPVLVEVTRVQSEHSWFC